MIGRIQADYFDDEHNRQAQVTPRSVGPVTGCPIGKCYIELDEIVCMFSLRLYEQQLDKYENSIIWMSRPVYILCFVFFIWQMPSKSLE